MSRLLILLVSLMSSVSTVAQIYKRVLPDGTVQFSDRPQSGAEEVRLRRVQTYDGAGATPDGLPAKSAAPAAFAGYTKFQVSTPVQDATLRDNNGSVSVKFLLTPPLRPGHTVDILMDSQVLGSGRSLSLTLTNVDRGTHSVAAVVRDENGQEVARAPATTFHLKRTFKAPLRGK